MGNFVVGGFLPGTNVQLSFKAWLIASTIFVAFALLIRIVFKNVLTLSSDVTMPRFTAPASQDLHLGFNVSTRYRTSTHQVLRSVASSWIVNRAVLVVRDIYLSDWTYHQD